jgi:hypothetical protein
MLGSGQIYRTGVSHSLDNGNRYVTLESVVIMFKMVKLTSWFSRNEFCDYEKGSLT